MRVQGSVRRRTPARWHAADGTCPTMPAPGAPAAVTAAVSAADDSAAAAATAGSGVVAAAALGAGSGTPDTQGPAGCCSMGHAQRMRWHGLPSRSPKALEQSEFGTPVTQPCPQRSQILPLNCLCCVMTYGISGCLTQAISGTFGPNYTKDSCSVCIPREKTGAADQSSMQMFHHEDCVVPGTAQVARS